jgi:hypothetical protein
MWCSTTGVTFHTSSMLLLLLPRRRGQKVHRWADGYCVESLQQNDIVLSSKEQIRAQIRTDTFLTRNILEGIVW